MKRAGLVGGLGPESTIVEACADEAARRGLKRPLLLGTRFTMDAPFFPEVFRRRGIELVVPGEADRVWIHDRYIGQLLRGDFRDETRHEFTAFVRTTAKVSGIDAVILGGTELPMLLGSSEVAGVPALDTAALHVDAIVQRIRS